MPFDEDYYGNNQIKNMKQLFLSILLLLSLAANGQDITDIFRTVPLPSHWRMLPETREQLIRYGKLSKEYQNKLSGIEGIDFNFEANIDTLIADKKNAYLYVGNGGDYLTMCYWVQTFGDEKYYLIAVQEGECASPGCSTISINFYIYRNGQYFTCQPIYSESVDEFGIKDFFKGHATKQQIESAPVGLTYELPKKGKDIIVHCDFFDGEGVDQKQVDITKQLLKGNTIKLKFDGDYFRIGEPYHGSNYQL
jgi:hypothetical protein